MDLRCRKTTCRYNKDLTCLAPHITISSALECKQYERNPHAESKDFSKFIFTDSPPKVQDYRHLKDVNLVCHAKCLFNRSGRCIANGITVSSKNPKCITFLKP